MSCTARHPVRWTQVVRGTVAEVRAGNVPLLAGGVAFYAVLALVPALAAGVSLYGLVVGRSQVDREIASLATALPPEARLLVTAELQSIISTSASGLRLSLSPPDWPQPCGAPPAACRGWPGWLA